MSEGVLGFLWLMWTVLFLILYHKVFTVYYFDLGKGLLKEIVIAGILGAFMAVITLALWYVAAIIIIVFGLVAKAKTGSVIPLIIAVVLAIIVSIVGISAKSGNTAEAASPVSFAWTGEMFSEAPAVGERAGIFRA